MNSRRSFDHLIGAREERGRDFKPKRLGGGEVDDEIELGWLLDRNFARLRPTQDLVDQVAGAPEQVSEAWSVGHQIRRLDVFPSTMHRRQSCGERQSVDSDPVDDYERIGNNTECLRAALERLESRRDVFGSPDLEGGDIEAERARGGLDLAYLQRGGGKVNIDHDRQPVETRHNLAQ